MISDVTVNQWANALFQLANEEKKVKEYNEQAVILIDLFAKNPKFLQIINSYSINFEEKEKIVKDTFKDFFPYFTNFFLLLAKKRYFNYINVILKEFRKQCNAHFGIQFGVVYSVVALTLEQMKSLEEKINKVIKTNKVELVNKIDESLIGGIKIKVKNDVFDSSIKGKLQKLRTNLLKNNQK